MLVAEINRSRRMGGEWEFFLPVVGGGDANSVRRTLAEVLTSNGITAISRSYSHAPIPTDLAIEYDTSVNPTSPYQGIAFEKIEMKTRPITIEEWDRIVPKALEIVRYLGGRCNASTGHHVHVGVEEVKERPVVIRSLYNAAHRYEPLIFGLIAPSRAASSYCHRMEDRSNLLARCKSLDCFRRALAGWDRCHGLNLTHLCGDGPRVEFRYHQGTLDADKSRHWRNLCLRLVDHACTRTCKAADKQLANDRAGLERMLVSLGLKPNSRVYAKVAPELRATGKYLLRRWKHFTLQAEPD